MRGLFYRKAQCKIWVFRMLICVLTSTWNRGCESSFNIWSGTSSKLVHVLAFGTPTFYTAPYDKIKHELFNLSSNCDGKSGLIRVPCYFLWFCLLVHVMHIQTGICITRRPRRHILFRCLSTVCCVFCLLMSLLYTVDPLYNDIRNNSKILYNGSSVCTKISGSCICSLTVPCYFLGKQTSWIFVRIASPRQF